ncbi:MAG: hypothetical protein DMG65_04770 [Candidatus Angelobacter sp. Gp1-AA117]|nr:MAG: hypothetical protein DMG65_04770 [Candidatus Angelobacter sp. Gp1-AA117]
MPLNIPRHIYAVVSEFSCPYNWAVLDEVKFFKDLGVRIKRLREQTGLSQEDMISHGFSVRYWQRIEAGKPITLRTLLRICELFSAPMESVIQGLHSPKGAKPRGSRRRTL